ncbi:class I SAM-dependent methyltransferase [Ralstonia mojiangensis]|uniref:class I SAM-dependent methyltransferase n=1 Tax=Ralstonia mojiangensis TaxID=2953895 RepID=UPI0021B288A8|nr:class I SAM-dependent methyltransferase [Ralstonia mojiangensis]MCT7325031.1 class I SAM-dependent methyltransferase [Ralstonia mojiangensis]
MNLMISITPFLTLVKEGKLRTAIRANALYRPFYTLSYLAALKNCGVMDQLSSGPTPFKELTLAYAGNERTTEALESWLQMGCRLKVLALTGKGYALTGLARKLSRPENDATLALLQEVGTLHHRLIMETPEKICKGELWPLDNQNASLTARSSRALEPFVLEAIKRYLPSSQPCKLLEIGCGSGVYIRHAAARNPLLTAVGLELNENVARVARENLKDWKIPNHIDIAVGDIRAIPVTPDFDVATLHNNIYYFAVEERTRVLERIRSFLKPGGELLLTTCCQGGNIGIDALNLWGASNSHGGRLPEKAEMIYHLKQAGYEEINSLRLIPGDSFYAFIARK